MGKTGSGETVRRNPHESKASVAHSSSDRNDMILNYEYVLDRISFPMRKYETM